MGLTVINQKNITLPQRDIAQINLCDYIPTRMIYSNMPFIYFVDNFMSLYNDSDTVTGSRGYNAWWSREYERREADDL